MTELKTDITLRKIGIDISLVEIHTHLDENKQSWMRIIYIVYLNRSKRFKYAGYYRGKLGFYEIMEWSDEK